MNISSAILHIASPRLDEVCVALQNIAGVEIHAQSPEGKVVVTIENGDTKTAADSYAAMNAIPGVVSVAMVYQYSDDGSDISDSEEVEA